MASAMERITIRLLSRGRQGTCGFWEGTEPTLQLCADVLVDYTGQDHYQHHDHSVV
jgi:hypothetical protein